MTDNTQELDEILTRLENMVEGFTLRRVRGNTRDMVSPKSIHAEAKQTILDWHNKQVKNAVATAEDNLDQYWNKELDKQVEEAMAKFHLKKGVEYDVKASDSVIVITHTNKLKEIDDDQL